MNQSLSIILSHCLATLPDSLSARKELLHAIRRQIAPGQPLRKQVELMISQIEEHEQLQPWLADEFRKIANQ